MATTSPPPNASEEVKAEIGKARSQPVTNKSDTSSSTKEQTVIKTKSAEIIDKRDSEGKNSNQSQIKKSSGIGETFGNLFDAVTKSGSFKDSKDGILKRVGTVLNNSDDMTSMFLGAGMTAGAFGLINSFGGDDDDNSDSEDLENKENSASSKAYDEIRKRKEESQTIASRIEAAMNEQNVANNLAGSGVMMKQLAMISIKTQESLISLVEYIQKSTKSTNNYLVKLKESIEEIDEDSGSVFQGLFPLLIGGLMAAITGFLGGGEEGKTFLETLIDKVTNPLIKKLKEILGLQEEQDILSGLKERFLKLLGINNEDFQSAINGILNLLSSETVDKIIKFVDFLDVNTGNFQEIINKIPDAIDSIIKISNHTGDINENLKVVSDFIKSFIGGGSSGSSFPPIETRINSSPREEEDDTFWGKIKSSADKISILWKRTSYLEEKLSGTKEILKEFISSIKVLAPLVDDEKRKILFHNIANDLTSVFEGSIKRISNILENELKPKIEYIVDSLPKVKNILGEKNFNVLSESLVTMAASKSFEFYRDSGLKDHVEKIKAQEAVNVLEENNNDVSTPVNGNDLQENQYEEIINGIKEIKETIKKIGEEESAIASSLNGIDNNIIDLKETTITSGATIIESTAQALAISSIPQQQTKTMGSISAEELAVGNSIKLMST